MKKEISEQEMEEVWQEMKKIEISDEEVMRRSGPFIRMTADTLSQWYPKPRKSELVKLGEKIAFHFTENMKEIQAGLQTLGQTQIAMATRGVGMDDPKAEEAESQRICHGEDCIGCLKVTLAEGDQVKFTFDLLDEQNQGIHPFFLTVEDDTGKVLRDRTKLTSEERVISGVPMGNYRFLLEDETGDRCVVMGVEI